jgi:uncharacterized protein (DUF305 family)
MRVGTSFVAAVAVAFVLGGCGDGGKDAASAGAESTAAPPAKVIQPGAPGEPSREVVATPTPAVSSQNDGHTPADVEFMQGMIHHHQQAVVMSEWVPDRTQSTSLRLMARRIEVSQQDEMSFMRDWLKKRGVDPNDHSHKHRAMPGMVNSRQLRKLKESRGKAFDRLFLRYMTQHHQGALTMVGELLGKNGGTESEIQQFVLHVDSDQSIEIKRMQELARDL